MMDGAQQPLTFDQVAALPAPPPGHVIPYGPAPEQFGQLRLPQGNGPFPVVIYVHGGCYFTEYSIAHAAAAEQAIADAGYAVWSLEYRRVGDRDGGWPGTFQDVANGADHLRTLAEKYPLDLSRVVSVGHSAGGNFALWLAGRSRIPQDSPLSLQNPIAIGGVLALAPAGDFGELHEQNGCRGVMDRLMGGPPASFPDRYRAASPGAVLPVGVPLSIVIAGRDQSFKEFGRSLVARAMAAGETHLQVIDAPDAGHFDVVAPTTSSWPIVTTALHEVFARIGAR